MANELFSRLAGSWNGTCRTWFQPSELADESPVSGTFTELLDGQFLRHAYLGAMQGKRRTGEEVIAFNSVSQRFEISWFDSFHMNYALMFSSGSGQPDGFDVYGEYDVEAGQPRWGWRTVYALTDKDRLVITAYNVSPDGEQAKAVETIYLRSRDEADR